MKTRTEGNCDTCGASLVDANYEETHTRAGGDFCNYACMEFFYGEDNIPDEEDFLSVPR